MDDFAPSLVVTAPASMRGQAFSVTRPQLRIGRAIDTDVRIDDPYVSRHHALIRHLNGKVTIEDAESSSGVIVNGVRLSSPRVLRAGDRVRLGSVELEMSPAPGDPPATGRELARPARQVATDQARRIRRGGFVLLAAGLICAVFGWAKWAAPILRCVKNAQDVGTSVGPCIESAALLVFVAGGLLTLAGTIAVIVSLFTTRRPRRDQARR